ncbi:MAG: hypothetical protein LBI74_03630 [Synergistaceae bacterium]|nr:hypothetical protein [Synergistaceae bacterium]
MSSIIIKFKEKNTRNQARAGFSIVEALMSSMLLASVMAGLLAVADLTFTLEDRGRRARETLVNISSAAAEINSGVLSGDFGSFMGISGIVETVREPYGPAASNVSVDGAPPRKSVIWRMLSIRSRR